MCLFAFGKLFCDLFIVQAGDSAVITATTRVTSSSSLLFLLCALESVKICIYGVSYIYIFTFISSLPCLCAFCHAIPTSHFSFIMIFFLSSTLF